MLTIIIILSLTAVAILCFGFLEIRIPFSSIPAEAFKKYKSLSQVNKQTRKIQHKRIWKDQLHKGFVELPA